MIAQDSEKLLVLEGIKRRGLFSWLLPKVIGYSVLFGLTAYGLLGFALRPKMLIALDNWSHDIHHQVYTLLACVSIIAVAMFIKWIKR